jgi:hypothetical protein
MQENSTCVNIVFTISTHIKQHFIGLLQRFSAKSGGCLEMIFLSRFNAFSNLNFRVVACHYHSHLHFWLGQPNLVIRRYSMHMLSSLNLNPLSATGPRLGGGSLFVFVWVSRFNIAA